MDGCAVGKEYAIKYINHILDNIHGHIGLTRVEDEIERTPIFKRLLNISQLGLVNRVFPCALHNRYTHSIGVMYVADQMSQRMGLNDTERQLLRLAGLLHDIGHYPLSHNVEQAYKNYDKGKKSASETGRKSSYIIKVPAILNEDYHVEDDYEPQLSGSKGNHHEAVGAEIIRSNPTIREKVEEYFITYQDGENRFLNPFFDIEKKQSYSAEEIADITTLVLDDIAGIVVGNIQKESKYFEKYSLFVQLIHSEMDADNIDYLLRDATFSGTTYGILDMGVLINSLRCCKVISPEEKSYYIVGVAPKGIGCVEQFFMNRYLAYTQIVHNKYVSILEAMMVHTIEFFLWNTDSGYTYRNILNIARMEEGNRAYLYFTDNYILDFINSFDFELRSCPDLTKRIIRQLRTYLAFPVDDSYGAVFTGSNLKRMQAEYKASECRAAIDEINQAIADCLGNDQEIDIDTKRSAFSYRFESKVITSQIPREQFETIRNKYNQVGSDEERAKGFFNYEYDRVANGVPIIENTDTFHYSLDHKSFPDLIVDSSKSALKDIYKLSYCVLRRYRIGVPDSA